MPTDSPKPDQPSRPRPDEISRPEPNPWRDSSLDLERGLDVTELSVDVVVPDLLEPAPNPLPKR